MRKLSNTKREIIKNALAHVRDLIGLHTYISTAFRSHISLLSPFFLIKILDNELWRYPSAEMETCDIKEFVTSGQGELWLPSAAKLRI